MKAYRQINWLITCVVVIYVLLGYGPKFLGSRFGGSSEIFPFFSWDLFSTIPAAIRADYGLRLIAINGTQLSEPVYFEAAGQWLRRHESIEAYTLIQNLGNALVQANETEVQNYRQQLESIYMNDITTARYEIVQRRYDLLQRWLDQRFLSEAANGSFSLGTH